MHNESQSSLLTLVSNSSVRIQLGTYSESDSHLVVFLNKNTLTDKIKRTAKDQGM